MPHPAILESAESPLLGGSFAPGRVDVLGGYDHYPPSVANGQTYRAVTKQYSTPSKPTRRKAPKSSFDEVGQPVDFDDDADTRTLGEQLTDDYLRAPTAARAGRLRLHVRGN